MNASSAWIPVGDLGEAFEENPNTLPPTADLVGHTLQLHFENGGRGDCRFENDSRLVWGEKSEQFVGSTAHSYLATRIRDHVYFVDFIREGENLSVSLVLDLQRNIFTKVAGRLPTRAEVSSALLDRALQGKELTAVHVEISHGSIDTPFAATTPRHAVTPELIDQRVEYTYSPTEVYEHIYLNRSFYTWHCLRGSEQGLGDTDRCHYHKIDEQLYLFVWREKIVPTLGVVLVDLTRLKTTGKVFGYRGYDFGAIVNFPVGAKARLLNTTVRTSP